MQNKLSSNQQVLTPHLVHGKYLFIDMPISILLLLALSPILLLNLLIAKAQSKPFLKIIQKKDCLGRSVTLHRCQCGFAKNLALLWSVMTQNIQFCGLPLQNTLAGLKKAKLIRFAHCSVGLFSSVGLHQLRGMPVANPYALIEQQASASPSAYLSLLIKAGLSQLIFRRPAKRLIQPDQITLFGLTIHNDSMQSAIDWALRPALIKNKGNACQVGYFINAHSVNLSANNAVFRDQINSADRCFADGSGMRLAAKHIGFRINENINGTDMLPHLCDAAQKNSKSIYMLGAKQGVAAKAAHKLMQKYPHLHIAGTEDGYFDQDETVNIIDGINQSGADILLVAMGSPLQERWLKKYAPQLKCNTALAVGGLFDYYSGNIARAPMWMRELGMEWVWRLLQEPQAKFNRYVIGNPLFLIHTFIFNRAKRGF
jgi:exopolysaccharide biosynthesis WecB/TagA/CpsF family protein